MRPVPSVFESSRSSPLHMNGVKRKKNSFQFCSPTRKRENVFAIVCSLVHKLLGNVLATFAIWRKFLATQYPRFQKIC